MNRSALKLISVLLLCILIAILLLTETFQLFFWEVDHVVINGTVPFNPSKIAMLSFGLILTTQEFLVGSFCRPALLDHVPCQQVTGDAEELVKSLSRLILAVVALVFVVVMLHYGFGADGKAYYGAKGAVEILLFAAIGLVCSVVLNTGMKRLFVLFKNNQYAWSYVRALVMLVLIVSVVVFAPGLYLLVAHGFVIDFG